ncbi:hypothetical protein [Caminibacter pacificus]|uniref:Uncharacterized protein n=1 Tax=Caminibacter pacificus TaxID=1424653 RepID=A0AAJ4UY87_9BACT|nr:hypothetical protein [Caminibacter pacificus]QCI27604.2 hypothetical protein C6V80_01090 [Caminibacter pacificus]ROR40217.1 hypothetical protein EDC58_1205 [Caminibacter pacificus]
MKNEVIFISESDKIDVLLDELDGINQKKIKKEFNFIFEKASNNYIGYFLFQNEDIYYKIYILPKIISSDLPDNEKVKIFINFLIKHYEISNKYKEYNYKKKETNKDLATVFKDKNLGQVTEIEEFVFYKFLSILNEIEKFFKYYKSLKKEKIPYISQSVKYQIDLIKNIKEINKTKIHQIKTKYKKFSEIANITYASLKLFKRFKISLINDEKYKNQLLKKTKKLQNFLLRKFRADDGYKLTLKNLTSNKTYKIFNKKENTKSLYFNILSLFGMENFLEEENKNINYNLYSDSLFIRPEKLYEFIIYDYFKHKFKYSLVEKEPIKKYKLKNKNKIVEKKSKPDVVITLNKSMLIIDAKWKIIDSLEYINFDDIAKLQRDCEVRMKNKKIYPILVYPKLYNKLDKIEMKISEGNTFNFYVFELNII